MFSIDIGLITGASVGVEFHNEKEDPDIEWALVVDLLIVRLAFVKFRD